MGRLVCPEVFQHALQFAKIDRLDQVQVETGVLRLAAIFVLTVSALRDEIRLFQGLIGSQNASHFITVHAGQSDIAQHDVRLKLTGELDAVGAPWQPIGPRNPDS